MMIFMSFTVDGPQIKYNLNRLLQNKYNLIRLQRKFKVVLRIVSNGIAFVTQPMGWTRGFLTLRTFSPRFAPATPIPVTAMYIDRMSSVESHKE